MRITKINLKNFRAFYGEHTIDLSRKGKNLLVYGENGSGKSSLLKAIELFIDSHVRDLNFSNYRNFFIEDTESGYIKLSMRADENSPETTYEWSESIRETNFSLLIDASKNRGSLDYKALLEIYFLQPNDNEINLFNLLIDTLLSNSRNPITNNLLSEEWYRLKNSIPKNRSHIRKIESFESELDNFNNGLSNLLSQLEQETSEVLEYFRYPIRVRLTFLGIRFNIGDKNLENDNIKLSVDFFQRNPPRPHQFLNEAKLSAIAFSIYLSALKITPTGDLKLLVLDDVLIGLDMSNRLPVIEILNEKFSDYQIFLMTYDKEWYEILKGKFPRWKQMELYVGKGEDFEIPVFVENREYLEKAQSYFDNYDYKAAAVYLRTAFEVIIKRFCEKKNIKVKYRSNQKRLDTDDFWNPIKNERNQDGTSKYVDNNLSINVEQYRNLIMNPLSHARITLTPRQEIQQAIHTITNLKTTLESHL